MFRNVSRRTVLLGAAAAALARPRIAAAASTTAGVAGPSASRKLLRTADGRDSEITVWTPRRRRGVVLFSHGARSAPHKYELLVGRWVAAGYEVLAPLHVDSTEHPDTARYAGMASWAARIEDMRALAASVDASGYVAAGHSYGGLVALTLGGAEAVPPQGVSGPLRDPRVVAAVSFSPPAPIPVLIALQGYATLAVPALIQTGDRDVPPGQSGDGWKQHLAAYDAAASGGDRYALVLAGVDHYFGGLICEPDVPGPKQVAQLDEAAAISTLFLQAYGSGLGSARRALQRRLGVAGLATLTRK
jgi:hypothetical protein